MKQTTIFIDGNPFTYDDEIDDITYDTCKPISPNEAFSLLEDTKRLFEENNIFFFLAYGTLLGAVRERGLIPGDEDVDVFIFDEDQLRRSLPNLKQGGLHLCRIEDHLYYSFRNGNQSYIDVYIMGKPSNGIWSGWCYAFGSYYYPKWFLKEFELIDFLGGKYYVPKRPERMLKMWYGKTWRVPVKGHVFKCPELKSHYYWKFIESLFNRIFRA